MNNNYVHDDVLDNEYIKYNDYDKYDEDVKEEDIDSDVMYIDDSVNSPYYSENEMKLSEEEMSELESKYAKNRLMLEILNATIPKREENIELIKRAQNNDPVAKEQAFIRNGRLVLSVLRKFYTKNGDEEDLIQEGFIGLNRAIQSFDTERGIAFSTYAIWWIRQSMSRYIMNNSKTIRIPVHMYEKLMKIKKAEKELELKNETITEDKIQKMTGISKEIYRFLIASSSDLVSLDMKVGEEDETPMGELVADKNQNIEDSVIKSLLAEDMKKIMYECLSAKEIDVICRRFGMWGYYPQTLEEIGQKYGVTRERIRQIEDKALKKLKNPKRRKEMREYINR